MLSAMLCRPLCTEHLKADAAQRLSRSELQPIKQPEPQDAHQQGVIASSDCSQVLHDVGVPGAPQDVNLFQEGGLEPSILLPLKSLDGHRIHLMQIPLIHLCIIEQHKHVTAGDGLFAGPARMQAGVKIRLMTQPSTICICDCTERMPTLPKPPAPSW